MRFFLKILVFLAIVSLASFAIYSGINFFYKQQMFKKIIKRLNADTRIAQVIVTDQKKDSQTGKLWTQIKFLEYDVDGKPLPAKYFTFDSNIIQFQSLVIRFNDIHIQRADRLRGKSAYLFWKVFTLDGANTQEYQITRFNQIPEGYSTESVNSAFERQLWQKFWHYALSKDGREKAGIKNAQIEAPGTKFVPGLIYTLRIEHDGGIRIDSEPLPDILRGEKITSSAVCSSAN
jgi:hypothetical protein